MPDLRIGAAILKESIDLETEKQERAKRNKVDEKAVARAIADKVCLRPLLLDHPLSNSCSIDFLLG